METRAVTAAGMFLLAALTAGPAVAQSRACGAYRAEPGLLHADLIDGLPRDWRPIEGRKLPTHASFPLEVTLEPTDRPLVFELTAGRERRKFFAPGLINLDVRYPDGRKRSQRFEIREFQGELFVLSHTGARVEILDREVWLVDLDHDGALGGRRDGYVSRDRRSKRWADEIGRVDFRRMDEPLGFPDGDVWLDPDPAGFRVLVTPAPPDGEEERIADAATAVDRINDARRSAGLVEVVADPELSAACEAHAIYCGIHGPVRGEDRELPGWSEAGATLAPDAQIYPRTPAVEAVHAWLGGFASRVALLDPGLTRVGLAAVSGYTIADLTTGRRARRAEPVLWPVPDAVGVPRHSPGGETPSPLGDRPFQAEDAERYGFPITVTFWTTDVRDVEAELTRDAEAVRCFVSTPADPGTSRYPDNLRTVLLIAERALEPDAEYVAAVRCLVRGERWERRWKFRTGR